MFRFIQRQWQNTTSVSLFFDIMSKLLFESLSQVFKRQVYDLLKPACPIHISVREDRVVANKDTIEIRKNKYWY